MCVCSGGGVVPHTLKGLQTASGHPVSPAEKPQECGPLPGAISTFAASGAKGQAQRRCTLLWGPGLGRKLTFSR